jgi:two-component sensor histidine kinase
MRELNHRSKNMFALVQAVARQTFTAKPDTFLDRFEERMEALAAGQDLLVRNEWKGVDLEELVRSQLAHFKDLIGTLIELKGPPLFISASAAQTIGMALHELATNAGKYGALSCEGGSIEIGWDLEGGETAEETFMIEWREHGGPPVTAPTKQGFGSSILRDVTASNLNAKVELGFPIEGVRWHLRCPAVEVRDANTSDSP